MTTIIDRFVATATRSPGRTFVVDARTPALANLSYGRALERAWSLAHRLDASGVVPGERIVLNCTNSIDFVCAYFGAMLAGCTVVPLDARARPGHVMKVAAECG